MKMCLRLHTLFAIRWTQLTTQKHSMGTSSRSDLESQRPLYLFWRYRMFEHGRGLAYVSAERPESRASFPFTLTPTTTTTCPDRATRTQPHRRLPCLPLSALSNIQYTCRRAHTGCQATTLAIRAESTDLWPRHPGAETLLFRARKAASANAQHLHANQQAHLPLLRAHVL